MAGNIPVAGLDLDSSPSFIDNRSLTFALNAVYKGRRGFKGLIQNEESNALEVTFPTGYAVIGSCNIDDTGETIYFLVRYNTGDSEIGIADKFGAYTTIKNDTVLAFDLTKQIKAVYKKSVDCSRNVYWVDGLNPPRHMNIDKPDLYVTSEDYAIFKENGIPCVEVEKEFSNTGSLLTGVYQFSVQYCDSDGNNITNTFGYTNPYSIISEQIIGGSGYITGDAPGSSSTKAIKLKIDNLNSSLFDYYNIVVVRTINGIKTASLVVTLPTTVNEYIHTGLENLRDYTLDQALAPIFGYTGAKDIAQANGRLFLANVATKENFNYQPYANAIGIQWVINRVAAYDRQQQYSNPLIAMDYKSFMDDEVYAFGIVLEYKDGTESCVYHIPGRKKNTKSDGTTLINQYDMISGTIHKDQYNTTISTDHWDTALEAACGTNQDNHLNAEVPRWKIYNTGTIEGDLLDPSSKYGCSLYGEMSYFETDVRYPDTTGPDGYMLYPNNGSGTPDYIRHHKFPDFSVVPIYEEPDNAYAGGTTYLDHGIMNILGIKPSNVVIPAELADKVLGWKIVASKRDDANKTVLAKGLVGIGKVSTGTIYKYDPNIASSNNSAKHLVMFSPDTVYNKNNIATANFIKNEAEIYGYYYPNTVGVINGFAHLQYYYKSSRTNVNKQIRAKQYTNYAQDTILQQDFTVATKFLATSNAAQSTVFIELGKDAVNTDYQFNTRTETTTGDVNNAYGSDGEVSCWLGTLKNETYSIYTSLSSINYVPVNSCYEVGEDVSCMFGGDTFITYYGIRMSRDTHSTTEFHDAIPYFITKSSVNVNIQYSPNYFTEQYDNSSGSVLQHVAASGTIDNTNSYNIDYSELNNLKQFCTFSNDEDFSNCDTYLGTRVIYSEQDTNESKVDNYTIFLPNSYSDLPRSTGDINQMFTSSESVYLRTKSAIYTIPFNYQQLETDVNNLIVGTGAFFAIAPRLLASFDVPYGGTESRWAINSTPFGVFMADQEAGVVYNFTDKLNEISNINTRAFFNENLPSKLRNEIDSVKGVGTYTLYDNPANKHAGTGLLSAWDNKYKRWLLTKRDYYFIDHTQLEDGTIQFIDGGFYTQYGTDSQQLVSLVDGEYFCDQSFTISYTPESGTWSSFHSYLPIYYVTRKDTFLSSEGNNVLHKHNIDCSYQTYYGVQRPFIVEVISKVDGVTTYSTAGIEWTQETECCTDDKDVNKYDVTFNKGYFYNDDQHTGWLDFIAPDLKNLHSINQLPTYASGSSQIKYSNKEKTYSIDGLRSIVKYSDKNIKLHHVGCGESYYSNNYYIDKVPNARNLDYNKVWYDKEPLRGKYVAARLIQDKYFDTKLVIDFIGDGTIKNSIR